jgi:hypothetical protein
MGQNRFAAQFSQSRKNVANYLQMTVADNNYLIAKPVRTRKVQIIVLSTPVDVNALDAVDQRIIQEEAIRAITKRKAKLDSALKKGYATVGTSDPKKCTTSLRQALTGIASNGSSCSMT